nr:immunoglobulin light chain junction region [Macaca mulatta]MPO02977.1 immunoglobulin light chain junction region [Macaca mulatta]MPO03036.1 immunoglobulin light chain junction region [Macaca mulatta]MPO03057.1 immunoglobulin light chain junction region [Macaca mulatta]MPO03073.1 immunoglobulin light chain junction region [Macaca mulatta]
CAVWDDSLSGYIF